MNAYLKRGVGRFGKLNGGLVGSAGWSSCCTKPTGMQDRVRSE